MKNKVFPLAATAVISAISAIFLVVASVMPTLRLALMCTSAAIGCACVIEFGRGFGAMCAVVCSLLALLLAPDKQMVVTYICLFAAYPTLKSVFEISDNKVIRIALKALYFAAVSAVFAAIAYKIMGIGFWIVFIGAYAVEIAAEFAFDVFIGFYMTKISPKLKGFNKRR